jgi:hypothetical protein
MNPERLADLIDGFVKASMAPLLIRLTEIEARPPPERGKDGTSVTRADVEPLLREMVAALPPAEPGKEGKSVTLDEVRAYLDAEVATWALSFERRAQDVLQRQIDRIEKPKDGRDGLGVEDFDATIDGRTITLTVTRGDFTRQRTLRIDTVLDAGIFREGTAYEKGDGVTFGGSFWIAQKDAPEGKPGTTADWRLAVKKGRDGADR